MTPIIPNEEYMDRVYEPRWCVSCGRKFWVKKEGRNVSHKSRGMVKSRKSKTCSRRCGLKLRDKTAKEQYKRYYKKKCLNNNV